MSTPGPGCGVFKAEKGLLLICHDRALLDGCVDHILNFGSSGIEVQSGNFSSWLENKRRQDAYEQEQADQLKTDIRRLKEASRRTSAWSEQVEKTKYGTKTPACARTVGISAISLPS